MLRKMLVSALSIALFLAALEQRHAQSAPLPSFIDSGQDLGGNVESSAVTLGDLDGDGDLDAVVASFESDSKVYFNQGGMQGGTAGIFVEAGFNLSEQFAMDVALDDLDSDGDLDIFIVKNAFGD